MIKIKTIDNLYRFDIYHTTKITPKLSFDGETVIGDDVNDEYWVYVDDKPDTRHHTLKDAEKYIKNEYFEE